MKRFRYAIRQFHRWSGLLVAIPFAVISITGACLAFEPQFLRLMHSGLYELPQSYAAGEVSIRSVSEKVERQLPVGMTLGALQIGRPDEAWIYEISSMRKAELFVDPSSGKVLGMIDHDQGGFYQLRKLHRWLGDTLNQRCAVRRSDCRRCVYGLEHSGDSFRILSVVSPKPQVLGSAFPLARMECVGICTRVSAPHSDRSLVRCSGNRSGTYRTDLVFSGIS